MCLKAQKTLSYFADKLYKISYLLPADLEKYLDTDSQVSNINASNKKVTLDIPTIKFANKKHYKFI